MKKLIQLLLILHCLMFSSASKAIESQALESNEKIERVGELLFGSRALSLDNSISCSSCHDPNNVFTDALPVSIGFSAAPLTRRSPSLLDVGQRKFLFWDGRSDSLEAQALMPILNPVEHGFSGKAQIDVLLESVRRDGKLVAALQAVFLGEIESPDELLNPTKGPKVIARALATFERTLKTPKIFLDEPYEVGQNANLQVDPSVLRGLEVFKGKANCVACHKISGDRPSLTDEGFHLSPKGLPQSTLAKLSGLIAESIKLRKDNPEALQHIISKSRDFSELGRFLVTFDPVDIGAFRTPSLRNVSRSKYLLHDGSESVLEIVMELELYRRDSSLRSPIVLSASEKLDLLSFLKSI